MVVVGLPASAQEPRQGSPEAGSAQPLSPELAQSPAPSAGARLRFDIPGQPLRTALLAFGRQAGLQVTVDAATTAGKTAQAVAGSFTAEDALTRLLAGTGLTWRYLDARTVTLEPVAVRQDDGPMRLSPITVTARRTEELAQNVPGSVLALPAEEIEKSNIKNLEDVALRVPNLNIAEAGQRDSANISIRGISDVTGARASAPTVGVYIDEVMLNPTGDPNGIDPNLFDLERIEVAYGPQGTAFGRGAIGGAVNYVTKKPTADFESEIEAEVGSFPDGRLRGVLNGSLTGDSLLMARLVAFGRYSDGFIESRNIGGSNDEQDYGARLSLRSQPNDRLTLDLSGSFDRTDYRNPSIATIDSIEGDGDLKYLVDQDGDNRIDRSLVTFRGTYDFDSGTLISNTSFLAVETEAEIDLDNIQVDLLRGTSESEQTSIGQELRFEAEPFPIPLLGETALLLGTNATWAEEDFEALVVNGADSPAPGTSSPILPSKEEVFDLGVFGELRFRPVDGLELSVGGRFSYTEVDLSQDTLEPKSAEFSAFTPKGSVLYEWTEGLSTYALISTGFKSGGFNALGAGAASGREFDNEEAINYEGGFKSRWFDDRLLVNVSGFALFYDDIQVASLPPPPLTGRVVQNAASARSLGSELEIVALPAEGLLLNLGYGFADAQFTDFEDAPGGDATGERLPNAPRHTLSFVAEYAHPVLNDFADAYVRTEYSYTSSFSSQPDVGAEVFDDYDVLNLRLGLRADRFEIEAFAENLLNEKYVTGVTGGGLFIAPAFGVSAPVEVGTTRRFGVRARILF